MITAEIAEDAETNQLNFLSLSLFASFCSKSKAAIKGIAVGLKTSDGR